MMVVPLISACLTTRDSYPGIDPIKANHFSEQKRVYIGNTPELTSEQNEVFKESLGEHLPSQFQIVNTPDRAHIKLDQISFLRKKGTFSYQSGFCSNRSGNIDVFFKLLFPLPITNCANQLSLTLSTKNSARNLYSSGIEKKWAYPPFVVLLPFSKAYEYASNSDSSYLKMHAENIADQAIDFIAQQSHRGYSSGKQSRPLKQWQQYRKNRVYTRLGASIQCDSDRMRYLELGQRWSTLSNDAQVGISYSRDSSQKERDYKEEYLAFTAGLQHNLYSTEFTPVFGGDLNYGRLCQLESAKNGNQSKRCRGEFRYGFYAGYALFRKSPVTLDLGAKLRFGSDGSNYGPVSILIGVGI
ncbi:hypothetical protein [Pseudobacteriovorax antillogorgiicola]|nr:hypothetical protein [Pseudobacteriovorax antillogorgiicola]